MHSVLEWRGQPLLLSFCVSIASMATLPNTLSAQETVKTQSDEKAATQNKSSSTSEKKEVVWKSLLPKEGMKGWEITDFGVEGKVTRTDDGILIEMGEPLNGITYTGQDFPTDNFEISLEANRLEGSDFLCGLTFPVGKEFCSFIAGGWGGGLVGLSSVDGFDASENETSTYFDFENNTWYQFKVRVDPEYIRTWIDDKEFFRLERADHEFSTRIEVYASQPLGFCAFQSKVAMRNFKWRSLSSEAKQEPGKSERGVGSPEKPIE